MVNHVRKDGSDVAFTDDESEAWSFLQGFVTGAMYAQDIDDAKAAYAVIGKWLDSIEVA